MFLRLMQELGWKRVAVLSEKGRKYEDYISALQAHAESNGITFLAVRKILSNTSFEVKSQILFTETFTLQ